MRSINLTTDSCFQHSSNCSRMTLNQIQNRFDSIDGLSGDFSERSEFEEFNNNNKEQMQVRKTEIIMAEALQIAVESHGKKKKIKNSIIISDNDINDLVDLVFSDEMSNNHIETDTEKQIKKSENKTETEGDNK
eukprot:345268_1